MNDSSGIHSENCLAEDKYLLSGWKSSVALLALLVAVFFGRFLFTGCFLLLRDLVFDFFPREEFYKRYLLQGILPLWNPYTGGGEPFISNMESGVFYPLNLVYLFFPVPYANVLLAALHVFISGAGTWLACRVWRISVTGAILAAIAFSFSTQTVTRLEFSSFISSYAWFPMAVALFSRWLQKPTTRKFLMLALVFAMQLLGGYPEALYFTLCSLAVYGLIHLLVPRLQKHGWKIRLATVFTGLAGMILVAMALSAVQILPVVDILPYSLRADIKNYSNIASINPLMFLSVIFPYIYGVPGYLGKYWAPACFEFWLGTFYVGLLPLILISTVVLRFAMGERRKTIESVSDPVVLNRVWFLVVLLGLSTLYAMGVYTPFFGLLWKFIKPVQLFRWPAKAMMCSVFAISCLGGIALDWLAAPKPEGVAVFPRWRSKLVDQGPVVVWLGLAIALAGILLQGGDLAERLLKKFFNLGSVPEIYFYRIPWEIMTKQCLLLVLFVPLSLILVDALVRRRSWLRSACFFMPILLFIDLLSTTYPLLPASDMDIMNNHDPGFKEFRLDRNGRSIYHYDATQPFLYGVTDEDLLRRERDSMTASWSMVDKTRSIRPMGDFALMNYCSILAIVDRREAQQRYEKNLLRRLGAEVIIDPGLDDDFFEKGGFSKSRIFKLDNPVPPISVVGKIKMFPNRLKLVEELAVGDFDMSDTALALSGEFPEPGLEAAGKLPHEILEVNYRPNQFEVIVESLKNGLLVTHETFYPGWEATVNGEAAEIYQVNGAFRAVMIPAGRSEVEMEFRPAELNLGIGVSLGSLGLVMLVFGLAVGSDRKKSKYLSQGPG